MENEAKKPKWRKDFPVGWNDDNYITRRDFTRFLVLASGAMAAGNGYFVLRRSHELAEDQTPRTHIATMEEVPVGGVKLFRFPTDNDPAILIRSADGEFAAFRQRCTHLSCPVTYSHGDGALNCPCHNGSFDAATGHVRSGPPPSPLPKIALTIENGAVYATGWEKEKTS
ncbi:MAG: Rieske (2Fe-2S) protein [Capsulimonas sp.]|uniref:QcrA and Rieske domain-containing protein n=1 Tax=Capsulimonas sp. TaxID=2494211 RepID=UPI003262D2B8